MSEKENADEIRLVLDLNDSIIQDVNNSGKNILGYSNEELIGMSPVQIGLDSRKSGEGNSLAADLIDEYESSRHFLLRKMKEKNGSEFFAQIRLEKVDRTHIHILIRPVVYTSKKVGDTLDVGQLVDKHLANSMMGLIIWDHNLQVSRWSKRAEEISGYAASEVLGQSIFELRFFLTEDELILKKKLFNLLAGSNSNKTVITSIETASGEMRSIRLHFSVIKDENHAVESLLAFVDDITRQRTVKTELKVSEERYRVLFESAPNSILFLKDGVITDCNRKTLEIFECTKEEFIGLSPHEFSPEYQPDGRPSDFAARQYVQEAFQQGFVEFNWLHKSLKGNLIDANVRLSLVQLSHGNYIQGIVTDLTVERENERKLEKSEHLFRNLFLNAPAAIVMVDRYNRVESINKSFEEIFGYTLGDLKGKELDPFIVDGEQDEVPLTMPAIGNTDKELTREVTRIDKFGNKKTLLLSAIPVFMDGEPFKGFGMYSDISPLKEKEQSLRESLNEKRVLLEEIHHRVKNNLAVVSSLLHLQAFRSGEEKISEVLNDCQTRVQSIAMVHELLYRSESFARISFHEYLRKLIQKIQDIQQIDTRKIDFILSSEDLEVNINQAVPFALLINEVVMNSYKHAFTDRKEGEIRVALELNDDTVKAVIKDNGIGLPDDFDERKTNSLGMTLIETLSQQLNADLDIYNDKGTGVKIEFTVRDERGSHNAYLE